MTRVLRTLAALAVMGALGGYCLHAATAAQAGSSEQLVSAAPANTSAWLTPKKIANFMERLEEKDKDPAAEMRDLLQSNPNAFECRLREIERKWFRHDLRDMIFGAVGGLGLFLYGMGLMSDGLKKVAGQKLKKLLGSLTRNRIIAILVGAGVTALVQSSSATTVMTIGFVNAGLLTLKQALCVILGANVGTTFTAWVVSFFGMFKISIYILPIVGLGFLLSVGGRTARARNLGQIMLGFGILFLGIDFMEEGFKPMRDYSDVQAALIWVGTHRILAVVAGAVITMLVQSSSASIAMIQTLAFAGAFGDNWHQVLGASIPLLLGTNIGTTITAQLAALRTSRNAKRTAWGHTVFNAIGVIYMLPFVWVGIYAYVVEWSVRVLTPLELSRTTIMMHIAVAHTVFNLVNTVVFLPMINALEALLLKILPVTKQESARQPVTLEAHLLDTPPIALEQSEREMVRMARAARRAVEAAVDGLINDDRKKLNSVRELEEFTDEFQLEITSYLTA
ncbi:MAG TPA: Na/Pi cotransporter family protein, partial [Phycisphaerales bacterium]|nr:Na/Pi cotransporter family protein [Phycisphaerales bacterium]